MQAFFYHQALQFHAFERISPHPDPIAVGYGPTSELSCISFPANRRLNCAESAFRLAAQLCTNDRMPEAAHELRMPGGATVNQMRRRLMRSAMPLFPIYILLTPPAGPLDDEAGPSYFAFRGSKHRDDNWCMLYIPADPELRFVRAVGAAPAPMEAHWAFTRLTPPSDEAVERPLIANPDGYIVYTRMPIDVAVDNVLWRCQPHKDNLHAFAERVTRDGSACACPLGDTCRHEEAFLGLHPRAIRVSLLEGRMRLDAWRATIRPSPPIRVGPKCSAIVSHGRSSIVLEGCYDTDVLLDVGAMVSPFSLLSTALFPRTLEPWQWFQRQEQPFELPVAMREIDVGEVRMHICRYEPRYGLFGAAQAFSMLLAGFSSAYLTYNELMKLPYRLWRSKIAKQEFSAKLKRIALEKATAYELEVPFTTKPAIERFVERPFQYTLGSFFRKVYRSFPGAVENAPLSEQNVTFNKKGFLERIFGETWKQAAYRYSYHAYHTTRPYITTILASGVGVAVSYYLLSSAITYIRIRTRQDNVVPVIPCPISRPYADTTDLSLRLPEEDEIVSRLSLLQGVTEDLARDILRRISAEKNWQVKYTRCEVEAFIERVLTQPGMMTLEYDRPGKCVNCKERPRTYRLLCKLCQRQMRERPPELFIPSDAFVTYVGVLPLYSEYFQYPVISIRPGAKVKKNKRTLFDELTDDETVRNWYNSQDVRTTLRGRSVGPVFLGQRPKCFPRGHETAVIGFLLRLGATPPCQAQWSWYQKMWRYSCKWERYPRIEPESEDVFLSHFKGEKLAKMLEARDDIRAGKVRPLDEANPCCRMGGFTKPEKSNAEKFVDSGLKHKGTERPRFICCPKATFLYTIGPYTHAQTKWLSSQYTWEDHLFYAGCATPLELNKWLNKTITELGVFITIADDISSCDASHSECSMRYHGYLRARLFGGAVTGIPWPIELHFEAEEYLKIKIGNYTASVRYVNGSGVSDTSFKNSALCIIIRLFAIAHAIRDLTTFPSEDELFSFINSVRTAIYTSASGDDGLTRLVNFLFGTDLRSAESRTRYQEMWGYFGFKVTVVIYDEHHWRLATYLAMRPTWNGSEYEFTPEPARRLRNLYWQLDQNMHPVVWARSISDSLLRCSGANPILRPIAEFYLRNTMGPVERNVGIFDNPHSPWHGYTTTAKAVNERAIREMFIDYQVSAEDYDIFLSMLKSTPSVYVNLSCHFLQQVYRTES